MASTKPKDTYTDAQGNKVVEPIFHGAGCVGGRLGVTKSQ